MITKTRQAVGVLKDNLVLKLLKADILANGDPKDPNRDAILAEIDDQMACGVKFVSDCAKEVTDEMLKGVKG